ncbi:hypothetical protein BDM02DRAFT_3193394 [Thelephora ganbajun]|uniref:Uncharacterized protein n=1 Tax=Thelephora ganbajun TaxID=370292 RepID=A0ACB6YY44_THEGA|nr:hypothetical protein BDM02DRAFT_3193394 [Thelephora ganbajun]
MVQHCPWFLVDVQKVIKSTRSYVTSEDVVVKYVTHLPAAQFFKSFPTPEELVVGDPGMRVANASNIVTSILSIPKRYVYLSLVDTLRKDPHIRTGNVSGVYDGKVHSLT